MTFDLTNIYNKQPTSAGHASGSIYELYNITNEVNYDKFIFDNNIKEIKLYEAIGLHYPHKGWIIHVVAPKSKANYNRRKDSRKRSICYRFLRD